MRRKPKGNRYRNLYSRRGIIYYERVHHGRRVKLSTQTDDWDLAAAVRDAYEDRRGLAPLRHETPTFAEFVLRYLEEDTDHLAATTRADRARELRPDGSILEFLGSLRLDQIDDHVLREWWTRDVIRKRLSTKTGRNKLDAIGGVLRYAQDLGSVDESPVDRFRRQLRARSRTQRGRSDADPSSKIRPVERPEDIDHLLVALSDQAGRPHVPRRGRSSNAAAAREVKIYALLMLDAGLRPSEAMGLRWGGVRWGDSEDDVRRSMLIDESRARGGPPGPTKSGRSRRVALSRRLRDALFVLYQERRAPEPRAHVLTAGRRGLEAAWARAVKAAAIGHVRPKDLRDTFASQLLTCGVQVGYVSRQLGHADIGVTVRHYAKWCGEEDYRPPIALESGEVPADLLASLPVTLGLNLAGALPPANGESARGVRYTKT